MSDQLWAVAFVIGDHDVAGMEYAGPRVVGPHDYMVILPWPEGSDPPTVQIDVRAPTPEVAADRASELYRQMRAEAQLAQSKPHVVTVGRVAGVPVESDLFIFEAQHLVDQQRFGIAVIAAQIHCEMHVRESMLRLAARDGGAVALRLVETHRSWSLTDSAGPHLFAVLAGVRPSTAGCWEAYRAHVARRNQVVHRGARVTEIEARESIDTAVEMVRFIDDAEQAVMASPSR